MADLAALAHQNYLAARELVTRTTPGGTARDEGPWLVIEVPGRYRAARTAILRHHPGADTAAAVAWATDWAGAGGQIVLRDTDTWALRVAAGAGFARDVTDDVAMVAPLDSGVAEAAGSVVARDDADLRHYARLVSEENGLAQRTSLSIARSMSREEGVQLHLLKAGDVVVARSMSCTWEGVTGVYNVYVPPAFRRRGFGRAVSLAALRQGQSEGATLACLQANAEGLPLYRGLGFQALYHYLALSRAP